MINANARIVPAILATTLLSPLYGRSQAAGKPKPGDVMIERYLAAETDKLSKKFMDGAKTLAEWQQKRPRLYREYMDMLGLWPIPAKTPLKATITGTIEGPDFFIDKLHYQSKPGLYVTANLYRPTDSSGEWSAESGARSADPHALHSPRSTLHKKYPAVLYVCGHANRGRNGNKSQYQDHGIWFAKNGYICLMLDTLQLGEIPGVHHGTYGRPWNHLAAYGITGKDKVENRWWWHSIGYTPAGVECWNGVRGIDYLLSRPDVDPGRIAVTGISGGGAATFWIAAADERVKCAVPVSGMSDLESYVKNKVINGHCDCMFLYNTYQWDWTTIAALVAPRPLLFANSDNDPIFPMDANRRIIAKLRKIYQMYGKPELVDDYVSVGGHAYRPDLRIAIFKWINRHVKGDTTTVVKDVDGAVFAGRMLRVFRQDSHIPNGVMNGKIDETFIREPKRDLARDPLKWRQNTFKELKKVLRNALNAVSQPRFRAGNNVQNWWETEPGITISLASDGAFSGRFDSWVVANQDDDSGEWFRRWVGVGFRIVDPRGGWSKKSPPNYVERAHALLGKTADEGRLVDVLSSVKGSKIKRIVGRGQAGILAAYAALFEPSIKEVVIIDPPKSHKEGPYFLNVLRVLDIPEALGLLAPDVKLTLINARARRSTGRRRSTGWRGRRGSSSGNRLSHFRCRR